MRRQAERFPRIREPRPGTRIRTGRGFMRTNHVARLLIALAVVAGATALVAASAREPAPPAKGEAGALSPALEPGDSDEGPADADAAKLAQLAYPAADIPLGTQAARASPRRHQPGPRRSRPARARVKAHLP